VALSWIVTHTAYTFRYAHLYYTGTSNGGLEFPGTPTPCDMDFWRTTPSRWHVLSGERRSVHCARHSSRYAGHALVSFLFNTTILALSLT